jgi:NAD(P)-dependent dehydrogenase (short-subunit alcohol dehydrogenase family)
MDRKPLQGQTALVTGAARRLGRQIALALAEEGVHVVVHYRRSEDEARDLCRELAGRGVRAFPLQADLGNPAESEALLPRAIELAGPLDILINNASIFPPHTLENVTFEAVVENAAVNAWAPFVLSRAFARQGRPGQIVNLLDAQLTGPNRLHVAYFLSKHTLAVLTRLTALEYAPHITVNAVAPGLILPPPGEDEGHLQRLAEKVPLQRPGRAADVSAAVLFLLKSDFITGQVIYVDGGQHLKGTA